MRTSEIKDKKLVVRYGSILDQNLVYIVTQGESHNHLLPQIECIDKFLTLSGSFSPAEINVTERKYMGGIEKLRSLKLRSSFTAEPMAIEIMEEGLLISGSKYYPEKEFKSALHYLKGVSLEGHKIIREQPVMAKLFAYIMMASVYHGDRLGDKAIPLKERL